MDDVSAGITAFKAMVESLRGLLALSKEIKDAAPEGPKRVALEQALNELSVSSERFKIELAKEWGYPLCRCTFPPAVMLRAGYSELLDGSRRYEYKCPECGITEDVWEDV